MRVVHFIESLEKGGLERLVTDLAITQKQHGLEVSVLCLQHAQGDLAAELTEHGILVKAAAKSRPFDLSAMRVVRSVVRQARALILHAHGFGPNYYGAAALLGLRGAPVLVGTCHDMGTRLSSRKLKLFYQWSLSRTARVAMVGRQVRDRFVECGIVPADKATTLLNGIPVERFRGSPQRRARARSEMGVAEEALVIGAVGRLVALKNHQILIEQLSRLADSRPLVKLVLIGGGELEAQLKVQVQRLGLSQRVIFMGQRADVADLMPGFDVFALPSTTEGLSISLLEACATSLAIVATRVGGNPEIVEDGVTGLLVPPEDGFALRSALERLLDDALLRLRLGSAAREWVLTNGSVETLARDYERFYAEALARSSGPA